MKIYNFNPKIIFFTGLSSSGKTTLGNLLRNKLKSMGIKSVYIDGDKFRKKFKLNKFDSKSRTDVGIKKFKYANQFLKKNKMVIISGVTAKLKTRKLLRLKFKDYIEVKLNCPLKICILRDKKRNIYSNTKNLNLVNLKYQKGNTHDISINTFRHKKNQNIKSVIDWLKKKKNNILVIQIFRKKS
jgi:adenylylsulfate kinase